MKLETGSKLGPYEILAPIGAGGIGEVYRAHDPQLGRDIAVKVLPQEVSADEERLARFENEVRLAGAYDEMDDSEKAKEQMLRAMSVAQEINISSRDTKRFRILQYMVSHQYEQAEPLLHQLERDVDEEAKANARKAICAVPAYVDQAEPDARLIEVLVSIRTGHRNEGIQSALQIVREFEESKLAGNAASARLAIAEALVGTGEDSRARNLALDALEFFEPHNVWESVWRAHLVAARVSERSADISHHRSSARSALAQIRNLWPSNDVDSYLQRADIKLLYGNMRF